ncbi:hypothetical protein TNCV_499981 [Trichonephila clavipes]|nr:hypothetical protein TNCV_499981 [Trichonephila clavipes]
MMIPAYNKKGCDAFHLETGIHYRRKADFFPEEDTIMSFSEFEPESTRLQAEDHSHHTGWVTVLGLGNRNKKYFPRFLVFEEMLNITLNKVVLKYNKEHNNRSI